jgi:hypothetical protein
MFKRTRWKILATLTAFCGVAFAAIGGTYANFTATPTTITSNAFASGTLAMTRSGSGAVFTASDMKIGDSATGSVTITNTGSLAGIYSLADSITGSAPLAAQIHLVIYKDVDNTVPSKIYDGSLSSLGTLALGTFAATTGAHTYYFHIDLPTTGTDAADNAFQGLSSSATFTWSATQA